MKVLVVCEPGKVMLVGEGGRVTGVVRGPQNTKGNPYLVFGMVILEELGIEPLKCDVTVATVTSGSLDDLIV